MTAGPKLPPPPGPEPEAPAHPYAAVVGDLTREMIWQASYTRARSLQRTVGASDLGDDCLRRASYLEGGVTPVNFPDPLRADFGTAYHELMASRFRAADAGSGRYLVEEPVLYRTVPGHVDLYDRRRRLVIDWKSSILSARKFRAHGFPTRQQTIQITTYALGLKAAGEAVELMALVLIPADGELNDIRVWVSALTPELVAQVDAAIDQLDAHRQAAQPPAAVPAKPSALCSWCPYFRPGSFDLSRACPGDKTSGGAR